MLTCIYNNVDNKKSSLKKEIFIMKKLIAILALGLAGSAFAQNFVSVDVDNVQGLKGAKDSTATYVRAGKEFGNLALGLQSRTATLDGGGMLNSLELTAANNKLIVAGLRPFVGIGHDNGFNGGAGKSYQYGLLGATTGAKVGPGYALVGAKTRVNWDDANPKQTVAFGTYMFPLSKSTSLNLNVSKSYQDIKENAVGLGVGFKF